MPLARLQRLAFGRRGAILHAVEFDFRAKSEVFHATSDITSSPIISVIASFWIALDYPSEVDICQTS